jgi:hypothetical protein
MVKFLSKTILKLINNTKRDLNLLKSLNQKTAKPDKKVKCNFNQNSKVNYTNMR